MAVGAANLTPWIKTRDGITGNFSNQNTPTYLPQLILEAPSN